MPTLTPSATRKQISSGTVASIYLLLGEDDIEKSALAADFAGVVEELFDRDDAFGLQAGVDDDDVGTHFDDDTGDDGAGLELGDRSLARFKQFRK